MEELLISTFVIGIIGLTIFIIIWYWIKAEKIKHEEEEAARKKEEERLRIINSTRCYICNSHSYGQELCNSCQARVQVVIKEIPPIHFKNFESTYKHFLYTKNQIISSNDPNITENYSLKLWGIAKHIETKYYNPKIKVETIKFLADLKSNKIKRDTPKEDQAADNKNNEGHPGQKVSNSQPSEQQKTKSSKEDYRNKYQAKLICQDGHKVRSKIEREIDDFFYQNNIRHIYEFEYYNVVRDKKFYPDFYLPDYNLIIEYFGRTDEAYLNKKFEKIEIYRADPTTKFEFLDEKDDYNIIGKIKEICLKHKIPFNN